MPQEKEPLLTNVATGINFYPGMEKTAWIKICFESVFEYFAKIMFLFYFFSLEKKSIRIIYISKVCQKHETQSTVIECFCCLIQSC